MKSQALTSNWRGQTAVCIGGGPSLSAEEINLVWGLTKTIAINDAYMVAPWADIHYGCDLKWWNWHHDKSRNMRERWTSDPDAAELYGLNYIKIANVVDNEFVTGLSDQPDLIHAGRNSGYQAINIAYLKGAARVLLLGYDMKVADNGASHWFGDHPDKVRSPYDSFIEAFESIAAENKIEIINCTYGSALKCFPFHDIREIL